jgi:hypothetical protein
MSNVTSRNFKTNQPVMHRRPITCWTKNKNNIDLRIKCRTRTWNHCKTMQKFGWIIHVPILEPKVSSSFEIVKSKTNGQIFFLKKKPKPMVFYYTKMHASKLKVQLKSQNWPTLVHTIHVVTPWDSKLYATTFCN